MADQSESSITDAVTHLHNLLLTKEKELKEREADFSRRVKLFESTNPSVGSDNDVIQLNIGGRTKIAVLRNLLTQFDGSMLAAKFSGRWDDSMEKDRDGNIFIDQDPDNFMILINYLRMRMNNQLKKIPYSHRPVPTYNFCTMLEYYNLMPGVYPQTWVEDPCTNDSVEIAYGTVVLTSKEGENARVVHPHKYLNIPQVTEFTVEFDKGTSGAVGWFVAEDQYGNYDKRVLTIPLNTPQTKSIYLNVTERKVFCSDFTKDNLRINHNDEVTTVTCQRGRCSEGKRTFSIQVGDDERIDGELQNKSILPMIDFSGKVTISGMKFDIDALPTGSKNLYNFESYS